MNDAELRAAFEAWAVQRGRPGQHFDRSREGTYKDNRVAAKWAAWSACAAFIETQKGQEGGR